MNYPTLAATLCGLATLSGALVHDSEPAPSANDKVAPGLVAWHAGFDAAVVAARLSARPVLHFQLLGQLDDAFC